MSLGLTRESKVSFWVWSKISFTWKCTMSISVLCWGFFLKKKKANEKVRFDKSLKMNKIIGTKLTLLNYKLAQPLFYWKTFALLLLLTTVTMLYAKALKLFNWDYQRALFMCIVLDAKELDKVLPSWLTFYRKAIWDKQNKYTVFLNVNIFIYHIKIWLTYIMYNTKYQTVCV